MRKPVIILSVIACSLIISCAKNEIEGVEAEDDYKGPSSIVAGVSYLPEIDEVPLPNGFKTNGEKPFIYDSPSGRIVEVIAEGLGNTEQVQKFYNDTLPQLGWRKKVGFYKGGIDMRFSKEDEELRIFFKANQAKVTVKFSLYPDPDSKN